MRLLGAEVGREQLMELCRVDIGETVRRLLYCGRVGQVAWKTLSVFRLFLSGIRHMSGNIDQADNGRVVSRFGDYRTSVAVSNKDAGSFLPGKHAFGGRHVIFKGCFGFLNNAYVETMLNKDVINALPARTIGPCAMHQYDILYEDALCLNGYTADRGKK
jgi:hypothetical protein